MPERKKIVLMPPNWLGDVILAQPALRAITTQYSDAEILVFGRGWLTELLPFLHLEHTQVRYTETLPQNTDMLFLFPNSFRSAWQAWRSGATQRIGFRKDGRSLLLTHGYKPRIDLITQHHLFYYLDLLQQFGLETPFESVELVAPDDAQTKAESLLLSSKGLDINKVVCVAPGAQFGGAKRYPAESYAVVMKQLSEQGWHIVVLGTDAERDIASQCLQHVSGLHWNAAGETSLTEALQLVSVARLMLCNDSGLMHVAAGLNVPTVTMFGATNPARTSPSGKRVNVLYKPAKCSPCLQRECDVLGHPCMGNILPEMVTRACLDFLGKSG
ncbi:lipopolysaccharide heptosyltransferase II [Ghiorsea bivora]|uniref:lipopolysaccharide heptosyltransferase II n=1 Tax=Ghiorsea bivora TaxID=1485545 RepID=UPI0005705CFE|nr:lipopolysaccharide heptosyltransferase II [Ghiorsea bivora]